ncbi:MAG: autotransporter-associated beta strand repeat-containing protein [Pirellulales bacterium]
MCLASLIAQHVAAPSQTSAAVVYWDINGATAGAGGATPSGTWDAAQLLWSTSLDGDTATAAWVAGNTAVFSAGSDATGAFGVTVVGNQILNGMQFQEGTVTLTGGSLQFSSSSAIDVGASLLATINSNITAAALIKNGTGTLVLSGTNTLTGNFSINAGTIRILNAASLGTSTLAFNATDIGIEIGSSPVTIANNLSLASALLNMTIGGSADLTFNGVLGAGNSSQVLNITNTGATIFNGNSTSTATTATRTTTFNVVDPAAVVTFNGAYLNNNGTGNRPLAKSGLGTLVMTSPDNTYRGATTITGGLLRFDAGSAIGSGAWSSKTAKPACS